MKDRINKYLFALREGVKNFFKHDTGFKVLSLAIAMGLWLFIGVQNPETIRTYRNVSIDVNANMSGEKALSIIGDDVLEATVTAKGKRGAILNVVASDFDLTADATNIKEPGTYNLRLEATSKVADVHVDKVSPTSIEVRLDYIMTKTIPIEVVIDSKLSEEDYVLGTAVTTADSVTVTGPETELMKVERVYAVLKVEEAGKYSEKLNIRYVDINGETVDSTYFEADVDKLGVKLDAYTKKEVPVKAYADAEGTMFDENNYRLTVSPSTMTVYGHEDDLKTVEEISAGTFKANLLLEGEFEQTLTLPEGIYTEDSLKVTVSVRFAGVGDRQFTVDTVQFKNVQPSCLAVLNDEKVTFTVRSKDTLDDADVYLEVDLENIYPGTQQLPAQLKFNNGKQGELLSDVTVSVTVEIE